MGEKYKKSCETPDIVSQEPKDKVCLKNLEKQRKPKKTKEKKFCVIF